MYLERVLEFARASEVGIASAERPAMILVHNMCQPTSGSFDVATSTKHFLTLIDRESKLEQSYSSVDVVRIPMRQYGDLYGEQTSVLRSLVAKRSAEAHARRRAQGCLFPERVWFSILEKVIEHFASGAAVSMSAIFARFLVSQSSLVNAAYLFFDRGMGRATSAPPAERPALFAALHRLTLAFLGVHIGQRALALGQVGLSPTDPQWHRLAELVTKRLRRRAVCAFADATLGVCIEEASTHGETHRCVAADVVVLTDRTVIRNVPGSFVGTDDEGTVSDELERLFREVLVTVGSVLASGSASVTGSDTLRLAGAGETSSASNTPTATPRKKGRRRQHAALSPARATEPQGGPSPATLLFAALRGIVSHLHTLPGADVAAGEAADGRATCGVCCAGRGVRLLDCGHRLCDECVSATMTTRVAPLRLDDDRLSVLRSGTVWETTPRPPASTDHVVECLECSPTSDEGESPPLVSPFFAGAPLRPGTGARILVLEGGGLRIGVHAATLAALQAELGDLSLADAVDLVGGSGVGGVAALALVRGGRDAGLSRVQQLAAAFDSRVVGRQKLGSAVLGKVGVWGALGKTRLALANLRTAVADATPESDVGDALASVRRTPGARAPHAFALVASLSPGLAPLLLANYGPERRGEGFAALEPRLPLGDALTASSALSSSYKSVDVRGLSLAEGGLVSNAPSKFALAEANVLFDFPAMDCVVSLGTGLSSARSGIWSKSCDEVVRLNADAANVAAASDAAHAALTAVLPTGRYLRLAPRLADTPLDSTTRRDAKRLATAMEEWVTSATGAREIRALASKLRATALAVEFLVRGDAAEGRLGAGLTDGPPWVPRSTGLRLGVGTRGLGEGVWSPDPASLNVSVSLVKVSGSSRAPVATSLLPDATDATWVHAVSFAEPGVYSLGVRVTEDGHANHVAGSPFLVHVFDGEWPAPDPTRLPMPPLLSTVMHFADFFATASLALPPTEGAKESPARTIDDSWACDRLERRLEKLALSLTPLPDEEDGLAPVVTQLASALLGSPSQAPYMLSMVGLWLTAHDHVVVAPPAPLRESLLEEDMQWDTYVAHATTGRSFDHVALLALANVFGVRFILVSAADAPAYLSFVEPRRLLRPTPIFVTFLGGSEYRLAEPVERAKGPRGSIAWASVLLGGEV
jgi:hypothetical protein